MRLNSEIITTPPRASATVVLLRDGDHKTLEVFLLRRHKASAVLGGVYVFPGGKLDDEDCNPNLHAYLDNSPQILHSNLGEDDLSVNMAAGLYVAAVREVLEECGVLYARQKNEDLLTYDATKRQMWQQQLHSGQAFSNVLEQAQLRLETQHLVPWSRWITPIQPSVTNKRFDTRFFVAKLPIGQHPIHDNIEAIDSVWLTPMDALKRYWAGDLPLAPPQIMTLVSLLSYSCTLSVFNSARRQTPPLILPEAFDEEGVRHLCYPGDSRHSITQRVMP